MQSDISKENITVIQKEIWKERNLEEVRNTDRKMERSKEKKGEKEIKKDRLRDKERESERYLMVFHLRCLCVCF